MSHGVDDVLLAIEDTAVGSIIDYTDIWKNALVLQVNQLWIIHPRDI